MSRLLLFLSFVILFFPLALRHEFVGIDTRAYYKVFDVISNEYDPFADLRYESGYVLYNLIISGLGGTASHLVFFSAVISLFPFYFVVRNYSFSRFSSIAILCGIGFYGFMYNGVRQAIAMGVVLFSFNAIVRGRPFLGAMLISLASLFHLTALIFFLVYVIKELRLGFLWALLVWALSLLFMIPFIAEYAFGLVSVVVPDSYASYTESGINIGEFRLRFFADQVVCLILLYFIFVRKRFNIDSVGLALLYVTFFGFILNNITAHMGFVGRVSLYFTMLSVVALPYLAYLILNKKSFLFFVSAVYLVFTFFYFRGLGLGANGMMPYATIWAGL